jgi:hypothetical protein
MGSDWMCMARMVLDRTSTDREGRRGRRSLDAIMDISPALKCRLWTGCDDDSSTSSDLRVLRSTY